HDRSPPAEAYHASRRRRHRDEAYAAYDRRAPPAREEQRRRERRDDGPGDLAPREHPKDRDRGNHRSERSRPRPERKESRWQAEGKKLFNEYAVPAIKAEGTKFVSRQIGNILARGVS
ncbi:hypothetical protein PMIN04_012972, partial [Paraphaeosphaeria minitans]